MSQAATLSSEGLGGIADMAARRAPAAPGRPSRIQGLLGPAVDAATVALAAAATAATTGTAGAAAWYAVAVLLVLFLTDAGRLPLRPAVVRALPRLVLTATAALGVAVVLAPVAGRVPQLVAQALATAAALVAGRCLLHRSLDAARRRGRLLVRTLVLGSGPAAAGLVDGIVTDPRLGMRLVGLVDERFPGPVRHAGLPPADRIVVAFARTPDAALVALLRRAVAAGVEVFAVPRFAEAGLLLPLGRMDEVGGVPVQRIGTAATRRVTWHAKRLLDVAAAAAAVVALAPLLLLIAVLVRRSSPGPVLFRQRRVGRGGREFDMLKFRTLRPPDTAASAEGGDRHRGDGRDAVSPEAAQAARDRDVLARQTRVGRVLRATSLDELPQLFNVLAGQMSLVGARPEEPSYARSFAASVAGYEDRHRLPVGLTGWAQVHDLRGNTSIEQRIRFDNSYIDQWSLWWDLKILGRTAAAVVRVAMRSAGHYDAGTGPDTPIPDPK